MLIEIRETCHYFKQIYDEYKNKVKNRWNIKHSALFLRLDQFIERCTELEKVIETNVNYNILKEVIIGGTKGEKFTRDISNILKMFEETMRKFTAVEYDVMDVEHETRVQFQKDYSVFNNAMKHIDKRVASVISQSFEDNTTFSSRFKLFEMFDELIARQKIDEEITKK